MRETFEHQSTFYHEIKIQRYLEAAVRHTLMRKRETRKLLMDVAVLSNIQQKPNLKSFPNIVHVCPLPLQSYVTH